MKKHVIIPSGAVVTMAHANTMMNAETVVEQRHQVVLILMPAITTQKQIVMITCAYMLDAPMDALILMHVILIPMQM